MMGDNTPWGTTDNSGAVSSLETRVRNLEIWRAECIIKERGLKLPEDDQTIAPLKSSDRPTRESVTLPAPFRAEEFGISATAPGFDPTGEGSAYQPPAEPAPGSDAEHPPEGYRLVPRGKGEIVCDDWIIWAYGRGPWEPLIPKQIGDNMDACGMHPCARPIPAADNDSRIQHARALSADVERLTSECAQLRDIAQRETERAESATVRAELAERQLAELRSKLRTMGGEG